MAKLLPSTAIPVEKRQVHAQGHAKSHIQATQTDGVNETTKGFRPAAHFRRSRSHHRQIEARVLRAGAALLVGLNLPQTPFAGGGQHGMGGSGLVFENPDEVNPLAALDDLPGRALHAQRYVWLAASRYDEYRRNTVCVCMAENLSEAYVVVSPEFALWSEAEPVTLDRLRASMIHWLAGEQAA
jgi:hypothetical protein